MKGVVGRGYVIREEKGGGEERNNPWNGAELQYSAMERGETSEIKSVGKRGGGRKVGSTWSVNAHIMERVELFRTRCADSFMSVHFASLSVAE